MEEKIISAKEEVEAENARIKLRSVIKKIRDFTKEEGLSAEEV